ncbi:indolepyruvate ferredoxin oxidoreductase subunit beta [Candidatus Bathyarchaeota archaeon]|nr:indolepyruvate ferredoxin oxidoreductase subunit beta [Candidatus Bathyarchaeota archaeon]
MEEFNLVIAGVGGQGILLAAEILGTAAVKEGLNVRVSEIHGMAQRGGAVVSNVRIGDKVAAPTVLDGRADAILGFEPLETLRNMRFASDKTLVLMSDEMIFPSGVAVGSTKYPSLDEVVRQVKGFTKNVVVVEAVRMAVEAGNILTRNVVMIGALAAAGKVPVKIENVKKALHELVPAKYLEVNVKAFKLGYKYAKEKQAKP